MWAVEEIPNEDEVYIRVALSFISKDNMPRASAFSNTPKNGTNLSCDWNKYSSPQASRELVGKQKKANGEYKDPSQFYFWGLNVGRLQNPVQIDHPRRFKLTTFDRFKLTSANRSKLTT